MSYQKRIDHLCLGHASIGAYSCFEEAVEALDSEGDGYCKIHAQFILENVGPSICPKCCVLAECEEDDVDIQPVRSSSPKAVLSDLKGKVYKWKCADPECVRCKGSGIDPIWNRGGVGQG